LAGVNAQDATAIEKGTLLLAGGAYGPGVLEKFASIAGGSSALLYYIPSASSGIRLPSGFIWSPPEEKDATGNTGAFEAELAKHFGVGRVRVLHSRDRAAWDGPLADSLREATAVWLSEGNAGRLAGLILGTRTERELARLLSRGGIVGGNSAGSIVMGSFTVRGRPDKPVLMARGHERGFGWLRNVAINPHLTEAKRENELINVLDAHPELLGIGLDEQAALLVRGTRFEVLGTGRVAIYDDRLHDGRWFYYLTPGTAFDLSKRSAVP
jgi:cyanophycinase